MLGSSGPVEGPCGAYCFGPVKIPQNWPVPPALATPEDSALPGSAETAVNAVEPIRLYAAEAELSVHDAERSGLSSYNSPGMPKAFCTVTVLGKPILKPF